MLGEKFASPVVNDEDGKSYLFAQKGAYSRFGVYVTHTSILIIFVGAMIGNVWGYKAFVNIVEGKAVNSVWPRSGKNPIPLGFEVRNDDFKVEFYEGGGRPKEYSSDLVVLENGQEVMKKTIEVNHPLNYKGLTFYQSSYGTAGDPIYRFRVEDRATGDSLLRRPDEKASVSLDYHFANGSWAGLEGCWSGARLYFGGVALVFTIIAKYPEISEMLDEGASLSEMLGEATSTFAFMPFRIQSIMENTVLMAVPLFIFMGIVLQKTNLAAQLLERLYRPDRTGRHLLVLLLNGVAHIAGGKAQVGQAGRIEPDPHGVFTQAKIIDLGHPRNPGQGIGNVNVGIVL